MCVCVCVCVCLQNILTLSHSLYKCLCVCLCTCVRKILLLWSFIFGVGEKLLVCAECLSIYNWRTFTVLGSPTKIPFGQELCFSFTAFWNICFFCFISQHLEYCNIQSNSLVTDNNTQMVLRWFFLDIMSKTSL